jgi:hypothetical protein
MNEEKRGFSARHSLSITLGLGLTGVAVWVIQLARWGEPVGYMLITAAIILVSVGVIGFSIGFILRQVARAQSQPPRSQADMLKDIQATQRLLADDNKRLRQLAESRGAAGWPVFPQAVELQPGQWQRTPEGHIINTGAFDTLDKD